MLFMLIVLSGWWLSEEISEELARRKPAVEVQQCPLRTEVAEDIGEELGEELAKSLAKSLPEEEEDEEEKEEANSSDKI